MSVRKPSNVLPAAFSCSSTADCEPNCLMIWAMYCSASFLPSALSASVAICSAFWLPIRLFKTVLVNNLIGSHLQRILAPNQIVQNRSCQLLRRDRLPRGGGPVLDGIHRLVQLALLDFKTLALDEIGRA